MYERNFSSCIIKSRIAFINSYLQILCHVTFHQLAFKSRFFCFFFRHFFPYIFFIFLFPKPVVTLSTITLFLVPHLTTHCSPPFSPPSFLTSSWTLRYNPMSDPNTDIVVPASCLCDEISYYLLYINVNVCCFDPSLSSHSFVPPTIAAAIVDPEDTQTAARD